MWVEAGTVEQVQKARKTPIDADGTPVVVVWHEGEIYAMADICIHKQRELHKGVVLNGRLVCPGHQWAYELATGYCRERDRFQPVHAVRIDAGVVWVDSESQPSEEATWLRTSS